MEIGFLKNWHFVLPEDGTLVPKLVGDAQLICILIKTVHLFGVINDVRCPYSTLFCSCIVAYRRYIFLQLMRKRL
jgi:hypothetical protein